jgi:hypothetical protein
MNARLGQHDLNPGKNARPASQSSLRGGAAGKSTLTQRLATSSADAARPGSAGATRSESAVEAIRPPLFADDARWETIDPAEYEAAQESEHEGEAAGGEEVEPENTEALARLDGASPEHGAADGGDAAGSAAAPEGRAAGDAADEHDAAAETAAPASMPSDAVELAPDPSRAAAAEEAHAGAQPAPQHRGHFERTVKTASGHDAKQDRYNRPSVRSHRVRSAIQIGRPGLRVGNRDEFHLQGDYAYRYMITSGRKAEVADKIWERDLQRGNSTQGGRLALNPSAIRKLIVNGVELECIMSWSGGQSAAWIAIKDLRGASVGAIRAAARRAEKLRPRSTSQAARDGAVELKFRPLTDPIATADRIDDRRYVVPGQKGVGGNRVGDYLGKAVLRRERAGTAGRAASASKRLEQANRGQPVDIENGERALYNVTMNLPKDRTPPVAIDVAHPGDSFFVPKGTTFRREISLYRRRKTSSQVRQAWAFGFVGRDEGARKVADEKRRGWVPLRVLA